CFLQCSYGVYCCCIANVGQSYDIVKQNSLKFVLRLSCICPTNAIVKLEASIYCRVDKALKRRLAGEVKRRGVRGLASLEADVIREALVEYFEGRDAASNGASKVVAE